MSSLPVPRPGDPWGEFALDPRLPANAGLRAADADRDLVHRMLATAYAEGRLDRAELEERTDGVARAKTLGELPSFVTDLLPHRATGARRSEDLATQALAAYRRERAQAVWGFLSASVICWAIWALTSGLGSFPWPAFVMLGTGLNVGRTLFMKSEIVADEVRRLEKRAAKQAKALPPAPPEDPT